MANIYKTVSLAGAVTGDRRIKISSDDIGADFLDGKIVVGSTKLVKTILNPAASESIQLDVDQTVLDHDALLNFVANEHIDWTSTSSNFSTSGSVGAGDLTVTGDFTVNGTQTIINTTNLVVTDQNILINDGGNDVSAEGAGLTVERAATDGSLVYEDALTSKWKLGALGSEIEVVNISGSQTLINKTIAAGSNTISGLANANVAASGVADIAKNKLAAGTVSRASVTDASGYLVESATTATEIGYVSGLSSAVQTQLDGKQTTTLTDGNILVGNGSNVAASVTMSGDVTISNTGVAAITGDSIVNADVNSAAGIETSKLADSATLAESVTFFGATDISGAEAETLTDTSDAASLHNHASQYQALVSGDLLQTSFVAAESAAGADVTGLLFANGVVRGFTADLTIVIDATADLYEFVTLQGIQRAADWQLSSTRVGDTTGITFDIDATGQVTYSSGTYAGFVSATVEFKANVVGV